MTQGHCLYPGASRAGGLSARQPALPAIPLMESLPATLTIEMTLWCRTVCATMSKLRERPQMQPAGEVTELLHAWGKGDRDVEERLFDLVLPDLRKLAGWMMSRERRDHTLQATVLLNEVYCRLVGARERDWQNRSHFFAVAGRAMRHLLIDYARARPKAQRIEMEGVELNLAERDQQLDLAIVIDTLLEEIQATHADWCSIVELKFFLGFTDEETAEALGLPLRTIQRRFSDARRWLYERLEAGSCPAKTKTTF